MADEGKSSIHTSLSSCFEQGSRQKFWVYLEHFLIIFRSQIMFENLNMKKIFF